MNLFSSSALIALSIFVVVISCYKEKHGTIRVELIRQKSPRNQYMVHRSVLKEYGLDFDDYWLSSNSLRMNRTNDSIALYKYLDNEFYGKIVIGKPGQSMNVAFDTAWSLSWVLSAECLTLTTPGCANHNLYNHRKSSYYKKDGAPYVPQDPSFNLSGFYSYENISIAHSNVTGYRFIEMVTVPDSFALNKADGVLGLGLKDDSGFEPFFYTLYRQKKIRDPIFSIYLNRDRSSNRGGNILLGFVDDKHIHKFEYPNKTVIPDAIKYLPVDAGQYWQFSVDKIVIVPDHPPQTENVTICPNGCKAISDTSSNEILGPTEDVAVIHDLINAKLYNGSYTVNCDTVQKLPKIDFTLGGQSFALKGPNYIIKIAHQTHTECVSAFIPSSGGLWVLGGAFLSEYYSIYNIQDRTIGFVRAA